MNVFQLIVKMHPFIGQDANPADEKCLIIGRDGMFSFINSALLC